MQIRPEKPKDDEAGIRDVHLAAFPTDAEARLVERLRAHGHHVISLVAEQDGKIVGHILFSPVLAGACHGLGLAPLAVLPDHQRQGIGSALVREGLAICKDLICEFVVVLGHPDYYQRFGFRRASEIGIGNEFRADESFMIRLIWPGFLRVGDVAKYGPEFAEWVGS
jgi:putative acetyltransferase